MRMRTKFHLCRWWAKVTDKPVIIYRQYCKKPEWWFVPLRKDDWSQEIIPAYVAMIRKMKARRLEEG